ncbi:flagellar protein FlaG [Planococcus sp. 4-30]|uniref:flagellar protein FlaG n=1 Tax=Planococcus sp. 4-30 TaxID=2874583 RepID=UPI0039897EB2
MEVVNQSIPHFSKINEPNPGAFKETPVPEENKLLDINKSVMKEMISDKVEDMNKFLEPSSTNVKFQLHEKLEVYYVQVIDSKTDEVLREIPNKKFLDMYASMAELAGLIVDEKL